MVETDYRKKAPATRARLFRAVAVVLFCMPMVWGQVWAQDPEGAPGEQPSETASLANRIDFGNAYIMGQSIKSGSVYLLHRKKSDINSMLKVRTDFREEIIEDFSLEDTRIISQEAEADEKG